MMSCLLRAPALGCAVPLLALAVGCGGSADEPAWAFDPIRLEASEEGVFGLQTWQVYTDRWHKRRKDKFYLCSVVVAFEGTPASCEGCDVAWEVEAWRVDTDCDEAIADDPVFTSLRGVGIGEVLADPEAPHPYATSKGMVDYGYGWEPHGWAYPETLDLGPPAQTIRWDGETPFLLWPTMDWPLGE